MKFRTSPDFGRRGASEAGSSAAGRYWAATVGDRVILHPDENGFDGELQAEVLQAQGDILRVRALHDLDLDATTRIVTQGAEFLVGRAHVHAVRTIAGMPIDPHGSATA